MQVHLVPSWKVLQAFLLCYFTKPNRTETETEHWINGDRRH